MSPCSKKAKLDVASIAWEYYRNFIDSQQDDDDDNKEGDVDELVELLEILEPHVDKNVTNLLDYSDQNCWLSILCSVAHCHLASSAMAQQTATSVVDPAEETHADNNNNNNHNDAVAVAHHHLQASLDHFSQNAATWSMGADFARMTCRASPAQVCEWYLKAADCASTLRSAALSLLDEDGSNHLRDDNVKEWIELLLLNDIVGSEYVCDDDDDDEEEEEEEAQVVSTANVDERENDVEPEKGGHVSASSVEATSRFMAAMMLSTMGKHDHALQQLGRFHLTHRLHPNVWRSNTAVVTTSSSSSDTIPTQTSSQQLVPCVFASGGGVLPPRLYDRLCHVLRPDSSYWTESDYAHRGYHSYFFDIQQPITNLMEDVIIHHLLPRARQVLKDGGDSTSIIVGAEWWPHTRPIHANLGHQLHFDTDEALLAQEGKITHPILSSVLYLTGGGDSTESSLAGATIVLDQTPYSSHVAQVAWKSIPHNNTFMVFPGNRLHGVLPCPGSAANATTPDTVKDAPSFQWNDSVTTTGKTTNHHRLTFMVGFWTRRVPDKMKERRLYGPCGPLPPANDEHTWVTEIQDGYPKATANKSSFVNFETMPLPKVSPAWESIASKEKDDEQMGPPLEIPRAIDHCFFVRGAPQCFRDSLFPHKN